MKSNNPQLIVTQEYHLIDVDESAWPHYYGYIDDVGNWYIIRESLDGSVRYAKTGPSFNPTSKYSTNWNNRTILNYTYWNESF